MSADIARFTYDPTRQYRSVIRQQGRVTLEADANEGAILASETLRVETIDLVGPAAAVGSGYAVSASGNTLTIGAGVFYLGGWRLELDAPMSVDDQPDWLDQPAAPAATTMVVALLLTEQSVCAVEDHALREVALGGPDSAARSRLMQHFLQIPMTGSSCQDAASTVNQLLSSDGVSLSPADQILSQATLLAAFVPGPPSSDPCTPAAAGGYLGADNQMIRVTVTAYDPNKRAGTLLWGWNNASFLYRCAMASDPYTLTLTDVPVDEEHAPQLGQWVEILRAEADLEDNNYIADSQGFITYLAQGYSFDTGEIVLNDPLPADYQGNKAPLFVRLWQAAVPFVPGRATPLDDVSGITVSISLAALPHRLPRALSGISPCDRLRPRLSIRPGISKHLSHQTARVNGSRTSRWFRRRRAAGGPSSMIAARHSGHSPRTATAAGLSWARRRSSRAVVCNRSSTRCA